MEIKEFKESEINSKQTVQNIITSLYPLVSRTSYSYPYNR